MANEWRDQSWGDLASLEYGKALRGYEEAEGEFTVYGTNGPIGRHDKVLSDDATVIVGRKGAYRGIHYSPAPCWIIDTGFYLKPKSDFDMRWAYYELLTHDINSMDSGSAIPSTSREAFYALPVIVPPPAEQRAIAHILGTLDDKIELNRRMNERLEGMARAIFKSWFVDFDPVRAKAEVLKPELPVEISILFPDEFEETEIGKIPKGWKTSTIGSEFNLTMGQSPPGTTYNEDGEGLPFFQGRRDFGFRYPTMRVFCTDPRRFAHRGDTLVSVRAPVGDINMAKEKCCIGRGVAAIRHQSGSRSYTYYAMHRLSDDFDRFEAEGTVFGAITKKQFETLKWLVPPDALIEKFEDTVFPFDKQIEDNTHESITLTAIRDALLPKLISGELRVKDAERLVERVV